MLNLKIIKDTIAYVFAIIIWIPTRVLSIILQLFNILCYKVVKHKWGAVLFIYIFFAVIGPELNGIKVFNVNGHLIDLQRIFYLYYIHFAGNRKEIVDTIIMLVIGGWLIQRYIIVPLFAIILLDTNIAIHYKLLYISKRLTRRRLVILENDIRSKRNGGFYNIQTFKEKYM